MEHDIDQIVGAYSAKIHRHVSTFIPESDVDDVTQEVLLAIWRGIEKFKGRSNINTWINRIASNKIADWHRKRMGRGRRRHESEALNVTLVNDDAHSTGDSYGDFIPDMVEDMPEKYARMVNQFFAQGMTYSEIAEAEDMSYEAIRSRYRRTIKYIREHDFVDGI